MKKYIIKLNNEDTLKFVTILKEDLNIVDYIDKYNLEVISYKEVNEYPDTASSYEENINNNKPLHEQFYIEDDMVRADNNWDKQLMPNWIIKAEENRRLKREIDEELEKENPDAITLLKKQRTLDKVKTMSDNELYQISLNRIAEKGLNKPLIVEKLNSKIKGE